VANISDGAPTTGNPYLDSLIWGDHWIADADDPLGVPQIAYYLASGPDSYNYSTQEWSPAEVSAFETALQLYENIANVSFVRVFTEGEADTMERLAISSHPYLEGGLGRHEFPDPTYYHEPLWGYYDAQDPDVVGRSQGSLGFLVFIHELGHALGLAHPHDGGVQGEVFPGVTPDVWNDKGDFGLNQGIWTTMSYNEGWDRLPPSPPNYGYQGTPMAFDIAALQVLYGANMTFHAGADTYLLPTVNAPGTFWSCIWDAGGTKDEISGASALGTCTINLNAAPLVGPNAGGFVSWITGIRGGFTIANGVVIENATGGKGNDTLTGNDADNILTGNAGNDSLIGSLGGDTFDGGLGADRMIGGAGDDLYWVDVKNDIAIESIGGGNTDMIKSLITLTLGAEIEVLELAGGADINGSGNLLANLLVGNSGANILDGQAGADTMKGGLGNDTYIVDDQKDTVDETGGDGVDTVKSSAGPYALNSGVENLTLTGKAVAGLGNEIANVIIGTIAANSLSGLGGNDSLSGDKGDDMLVGGADADTLDGGAGADSMAGGAGNDLYRIDTVGDSIDPGADDGIDTVESAITFVLGAQQERLTLLGAAALNGTGNDGSNVITGNVAANILSGGSKGEIDTLAGGVGNDTYWVDASGDAVTEADKGGTDLVKSSASFALSGFVENLTLIGDGDIDGAGNALANVIIGNTGANALSGDAGNDTLTGGAGDDTLDGGTGNDAMTGGDGDDAYGVDSATDKVTESSAAGGRDKVESSITYVLGNNLEDLDLTKAGVANGTGNALDNRIVGSAAANLLDGKAGSDTMEGRGGNDTYVVDKLTDVVDESTGSGSDTIQIATAFNLGAPSITVLGAIENVTLTGTAAVGAIGNAVANILSGNGAANALSGLGDNDSLSGGAGNDNLLGGAGNDTLDGGAGVDAMVGDGGDDVYVVDNAKDSVQETGSDAADRINAFITIDLALYGNIEDVTLLGTGAINATGIDGKNNHLTGNTGANILDGKGGDDTLAGDKGNDTYKVDSSADVVIEVANGGTDTVMSTAATYTLGDANVENLTLLGAALIGIGSDGKNILTGNAFANTLDGDVGADTLVGGKGNDLYRVDDAKDVVTEAAGADTGTDTVESIATSYVLAANVEHLTLLGTGDIAGTGNTLDNTLTGNAGANALDGKAGKDHMIGGAGNDGYIVDNISDVVDELGGSGSDTVNSSISFSLANVAVVLGAVEHLALTGAGALTGTGNDLANKITGNAGANLLSGGGENDSLEGAAGADTLDGGAGNDVITGGAGNDRVNVGDGNDTVLYTSKLDGKDVIDAFDGDSGGGQDVLDLDGLFDKLSLSGSRESHVNLVANGAGVDIRVDADGNAANGFELVAATLNLANPTDSISVGQDVLVGS
jgi:Ca2+-binding RTX toxin-like protein